MSRSGSIFSALRRQSSPSLSDADHAAAHRQITGRRIATFQTRRTHDPSEVSGLGLVAHGIRTKDGLCLLRWHGAITSVALYRDITMLEAVHGHNGATTIEWLPPAQALADYHDWPQLIWFADVLPAWFHDWV